MSGSQSGCKGSWTLTACLDRCGLDVTRPWVTSDSWSTTVYSAAQIYPNYAYAYYTCVFCIYAYVNTRVHTRVCLFVMHSHKFLYMKHCRLNKTLFLWEWERFQSEICILFKTCMPMNESNHISTFRSLRKFTDKLPFLWHLIDVKLRKMGRKLKQLLEVPILTRELYVFTRTDLCFSTCRQVVWEMFI